MDRAMHGPAGRPVRAGREAQPQRDRILCACSAQTTRGCAQMTRAAVYRELATFLASSCVFVRPVGGPSIAVQPPSTSSAVPVTYLAASLARQATAAATS